MSKPSIYLIGSLRNPELPKLGNYLRELGFDVFDDWFAAGPIADDSWQEYEKGRNHTYGEAIRGYASKHVVSFDHKHLNRCEAAVLMLPAGRSGHLEAGYVARTKPTFILFQDEPSKEDRWDQMYALVFENGGDICFSKEELGQKLKDYIHELEIR